jgi:hypothetical protein
MGNSMTVPVYPYFYFKRERDVEINEGYALAGLLFLDEPELKAKGMSDELKKVADRIIWEIVNNIELDDEVFGAFLDEGNEADQVDVDNYDLIKPWADNCAKIVVRAPGSADIDVPYVTPRYRAPDPA